MTSDHRVAGSSPAGCNSSTRADPMRVISRQNLVKKKTVTCHSFATFSVNPPALNASQRGGAKMPEVI
jgi:hypothetical protein